MTVLTQDMARQFLNNSTPYDKYKFFMKGTQLEHLDGDYLIVEQNIDTIDQELWKKTQDLRVFEEEASKARNLLALSEKQDALRARIKNIADQMAWAQVEEQERTLETYDKKLVRTAEKIAALEMTAGGYSEAFSQTEQSVEHANKNAEEAKEVLAPLQEQKADIKREHDRFKAEQMALHVSSSIIIWW